VAISGVGHVGASGQANHLKALALVVVIVVCSAVSGAAQSAARDPSVLILRKADIGATEYEPGDDLDDYLRQPLKAAGLSGRVATYYGSKFSDAKGFVQVSGVVLTVGSASDARRVYAITAQARDRMLRRSASGWTRTSFPSYGDQQRALFDPPGDEGIGHAELIVRRKTTVWLLYVTIERRPKPPVSELVADLERFATKQKQRIGSG
jgi:hypothetical protein